MRGCIKLTLVILSLAILYWPGIQNHWVTMQDPYFVPFDAVQYIPPFFKYDLKDPIPTTYVKEYYLNAVCPLLYKWLTILGARFIDARSFQLGMMYLAYAVFIAMMGRIGWALGGATLSFSVVAITVTAWIFFGLGFLGEAPRMYSYPLASVILYSLIRDRPYTLAMATVLGGALYPVVAMIGGLCLASWLFLRPLSNHSIVANWNWSRRLITLSVTGFLTIATLMPLILDSSGYGRRVVEADIAMYPEVGPEGGFLSYDRLPYKLFGFEWTSYFIGTMYSHGDPIVPQLNAHKNFDNTTFLFVLAVTGLIIFIIVLRGIKLSLKEDHSGVGTRMMTFFIVCIALHVIAWLVSPYLFIPNRYLMFSLPFIITVLFPWSLYVILNRFPMLQLAPKLRNAVFLGIVGVYLVAFGDRGNVNLYGFSVDEPSRPLVDAISVLPRGVLIAGWPIGLVQKVEYVTRRNVFLTLDIHQLFYLEFVKVMRERMDALFDAYLSTDAAPLYRLRQKFGVTHLIVDTRDFTDPKHAPEYFAPWEARIQPRLQKIKGKEYLLNRQLRQTAAVFDQNGLLLLDLAKLP
jgi:hypothetical protein